MQVQCVSSTNFNDAGSFLFKTTLEEHIRQHTVLSLPFYECIFKIRCEKKQSWETNGLADITQLVCAYINLYI